MRSLLLAVLAGAVLSAADPALAGTWVGPAPELAGGGPLVLAMIDRNGTCCGGPAAAFAGLANLRAALKDRPDIRLVAVDVTPDGTAEQAAAAAQANRVEGLPLLVDAARANAAAMQVPIEMTMTYIVQKADGAREVVHSPGLVRKALGL